VSPTSCARCGAELPVQLSRGRPRLFCGERCRRTAGRVRLARTTRIEDLRAVVAGQRPWWWAGSVAGAREELAELTARS